MTTMKTQSNASEVYFSNSGRKVLEYLSSDTIKLDFPFILTEDKRLTKNLPYLKLERRTIGEDIAAIRLLNIQVDDGIVYLIVQDLNNNESHTLSWNLEYDGDYWLWSLADFETVSESV